MVAAWTPLPYTNFSTSHYVPFMCAPRGLWFVRFMCSRSHQFEVEAVEVSFWRNGVQESTGRWMPSEWRGGTEIKNMTRQCRHGLVRCLASWCQETSWLLTWFPRLLWSIWITAKVQDVWGRVGKSHGGWLREMDLSNSERGQNPKRDSAQGLGCSDSFLRSMVYQRSLLHIRCHEYDAWSRATGSIR